MKKRLIAGNWPAWALTAASFLFAAGVIFFFAGPDSHAVERPARQLVRPKNRHFRSALPPASIYPAKALFSSLKNPWFAPKLAF